MMHLFRGQWSNRARPIYPYRTMITLLFEILIRRTVNFRVNHLFTLMQVDKKRVGSDTKKQRQMFVIRHGERVDFVYGRGWVDKSFDDKGIFINLLPDDKF